MKFSGKCRKIPPRIPVGLWEGPHTVWHSQGPDSRGLPLLREGARLHESQHPGSDSSRFRPSSASNHRPEVEEGGIFSPETERVWGGHLREPLSWKSDSRIRSAHLHLGFPSSTMFSFPLLSGSSHLGLLNPTFKSTPDLKPQTTS